DAGDGRMTEGAAAMPQDCEPAASGLEEPDPAPALAALAEGAPVDAFAWLGPHRGADGGWRLRVLFPGARAVAVRTRDGGWSALRGASVDGAFEGEVATGGVHLLQVDWGDRTETVEDAYGFGPLLDDGLLQRLSAGDGEACREALGARAMQVDGVDGVRF